MSKKPKTYVVICLDASSSMASTKNAAIQGYNEHVHQIQDDAKDQDIVVCLITFNGQVYEHLWAATPEQLKEANAEDYVPRGCTAMRDAMGYAIKKLEETIAGEENPDDVSVLFITISDGEENSSQHIGAAELNELIKKNQDKGTWTFSFIGCDKEYLMRVAQETSIPISNMAAWDNQQGDDLALRGMRGSTDKMKKYFRARGTGVKGMAACYASDNISLCADYVDGDIGDVADPTAGQQKSAAQPAAPIGSPAPPHIAQRGKIQKFGGPTSGYVANLTSDLAGGAAVMPSECSNAAGGGVFAADKVVEWGKYTSQQQS